MYQMDQEIERLADTFNFENKSVEEIGIIFDNILKKIFEDRVCHRGRVLTIQKFALCIVKRAKHLDSDSLLSHLKLRFHLVCLTHDFSDC
jgi:hypothetical protein